jgi:hypothetical protein
MRFTETEIWSNLFWIRICRFLLSIFGEENNERKEGKREAMLHGCENEYHIRYGMNAVICEFLKN